MIYHLRRDAPGLSAQSDQERWQSLPLSQASRSLADESRRSITPKIIMTLTTRIEKSSDLRRVVPFTSIFLQHHLFEAAPSMRRIKQVFLNRVDLNHCGFPCARAMMCFTFPSLPYLPFPPLDASPSPPTLSHLMSTIIGCRQTGWRSMCAIQISVSPSHSKMGGCER